MNFKLLRGIIIMSKFVLYGTILQLLFLQILLAADSKAQSVKSVRDVRISVAMVNASVEDVFKKIEQQTDYKFTYDIKDLRTAKRVTLSFNNGTVYEILEELARVNNFHFRQTNKDIDVRKVNRHQESDEVVEVFLQAINVTGRVIANDSPDGLPGVNVVVKGTNQGTVTDVNGNYSISVPGQDAVLVFSSVGYTTEEVTVGNRSTINLTMNQDIKALQEVVVIGYGTVKKSDLTGSVSSIKSEELTAYPAIEAVQALQGRAAGVQISATNGEPGSDYKVRIRGGTSINASSDPIYVVDGFVGAEMPPPEDIASIEVLKDASATAIYGSRGANGVIMVTTKRGKEGGVKIDFNASYTPQKEINRLDLLNAEQFVDYANDITPGFERYTGPNGEVYDTDWQDLIFRTGNIQNYQLGFSGGSDEVKYYLSGTMFDQSGIIIGSEYQRFSVISNIDIKPSEKFSFGLNLFGRRTSSDGTRTQEGSGGTTSSGVTSSAFKFEPDQPIYDANGNFTLARMNDAHDNAYAIATRFTNQQVIDRVQGNVYGEYVILPDLTFKTTFGGSVNSGRTGTYTPTSLQGGRGTGGSGEIEGTKYSLFLNENYLTWNKQIGKNDFSIMGGYSYQKSRNERWGGEAQNFITDAGLFWNMGATSVWLSPSSNLTEWELSSYYARMQYSFNSKYLVTLNARYDGSSTFSKNNKWAFFPSGALAWNMHEEDFMSSINAISNFKWRVSYGVTGNTAISPYQTLSTFDDILTIQGGNPVNAVAPRNLPNDNLTWESTSQFDIGVDIGLFNDRLNIVADYYRMVTDDLLFDRPLPEYIGLIDLEFTSNIGKVENKGFEFSINSRNIASELIWDMGFNISFNRNKILELPDGLDIPYGSGPGHMVGLGQTQILREGEPVGVFYGWFYDGVYQEGDEILPGGGFEQKPGGEKFRDIDGTKDEEGNLTGLPDNKLNSDDRTIIGNPHPDFIWGWNNDLKWKGFDMNIFFQSSQGNDIYSYTLMELDILSGSNNATTAALNRWTPTNTDTNVPAAVGGRTRRASSRWVLDGSYIRLKNISLGYTLPTSIVERFNIRNLRLYVSAQNMLTLTDYEGFDPEVNYRTSGNRDGNRNLGLDYASYPNAKGVTFGINLGF